jgi:ABC-2 type transport system permease protein
MAEVYRAIWVIAYREILRFVQERSRMFSSFATPLLFLIIFGAGFNRLIGSLTPGVDFIKFMYPGIMAMTVLMTSIFSGLSVVWDREFGFLKEVLVAPLSRSGVILGKAVGGTAVALTQGIIMLVLAPFLGVGLSWLLVLKLIPLLVLVSLSLSGLGLLVASRMRSQQGFQVVMQLLIFPLMFLSGVFFPVNSVPTWLGVIAKANPVTYGVDAIRQVFLGNGAGLVPAGATVGGSPVLGVSLFGHTMSVAEDMLVVALFGLVVGALAVWSFSQQE